MSVPASTPFTTETDLNNKMSRFKAISTKLIDFILKQWLAEQNRPLKSIRLPSTRLTILKTNNI